MTGGSAVRDPDRPTLVALSGGPDSSALLLALTACKPARIMAAHIRHNLRPDSNQNADLQAARLLADRQGVELVTRDISIQGGSNVEGEARKLRYQALAEIAAEHGCRFVATGHHADDQLETMLMTLTRGAGPAGLSGIRPTRRLSPDVTLIRPALVCTHRELVSICTAHNIHPAHDETNDDLTRRRAWLRAKIIPELLEQADDDLPARLINTQALLADAHALGEERAAAIMEQAEIENSSVQIPQIILEQERPLVIGAYLRQAAQNLIGEKDRDALGWKHLEPIIERIQSCEMHAKSFDLRGLRVTVTNQLVRMDSLAQDVPPGV